MTSNLATVNVKLCQIIFIAIYDNIFRFKLMAANVKHCHFIFMSIYDNIFQFKSAIKGIVEFV